MSDAYDSPDFVLSNKKNARPTLNFRPRTPPSRLYPPLVVDGVQISGFDSDLEAINLHENLAATLLEVYPKLSLPELARLVAQLKGLGRATEDVLQAYNQRDNEILQQAFAFISKLPDSLQDFLSEKEFHLGDLRAILPNSSQHDECVRFLSHCVDLRMSKSQIVEACELANELRELGSFQWPEGLTRDQILENLKRQRFPLAMEKDLARTQSTKQHKWPHRSQVRWVRNGDLSGLEIKFFVTSPLEYSRSIGEMTKIPVEEIWK